MKIRLLLLPILFLSLSLFAQSVEKYSRAKVHLDQKGHNISELAQLGITADHGEHKLNTFFVSDFSATELKKMRAAGFKYDVQIDDVNSYYASLVGKPGSTGNKTTNSPYCNMGDSMAVPTHFHLGSYGTGYFTYAEFLAIVDSMHTLYPGLISVRDSIDTIHSIQGRPIYWVRVSNNPSVEQPAKPQILYTALHHAREPGTISSMVYYLWYLLEQYGVNTEVKTIVDNTEMYFILCVNPDGYLQNIATSMSGGGMWRKNMRNNGDGTNGVDLNRNYGYFFGYDDIGSSPTTSSETYRGRSGFSEPETRAVKWLTEHHHFKIALNYHTFGNDIIYPWGYIASLRTTDSNQFSAYAKYLTENTMYRFGTGDQTVGYVTNGDSDDWMYGDTTAKPKVFAFTPETGFRDFGFYTTTENIIPDCRKNLRTNVRAAKLLLPFGEIINMDAKILTSTNGNIHYRFKRLGFPDTATFNISVHSLDSRLTLPTTVKTYTNPSMLQVINDSFTYSINTATPNGALLQYEIVCNNGFYTHRDTVGFYYGKYYVNIVPNTSSLTDWTNSGWGVCSTYYSVPPASLGSSVGCANYSDMSDNTLQYNNHIDLTHAYKAFAYYDAIWSIESSYDYVDFEAQTAGSGAWQPMCGRYTKPGTSDQLSFQPIYDGQQPDWVKEEVDMNDYIGSSTDVRFQLVSDMAVNYPGFYFDHMNVIYILDSEVATSAATPVIFERGVSVTPNPAQNEIKIAVGGVYATEVLNYEVVDISGRKLIEGTFKSNITVDVQNLTNGLYFVNVKGCSANLPVTKFLKQD